MPTSHSIVPRAVLAVVLVGALVACFAWPVAAVVLGAVVVVALVPMSSSLSGRVGVVALLWLSWSQFAYRLPWPTDWPPRQAVAWTLAVVLVLGFRLWRPAGLRDVLPHWDAAASALLVFAGVLVWWFWPWQGDATHVLDRLLLGWDNSGHFAMVEQLRLPHPDAATAFAGYPRGFHALVASLMELASGAPGSVASEVVAYAYGSLAVLAAALLMVTAWVLSSDIFRRRPLLLAPALATLITVYLQLEDAAQIPFYGFGNFGEAAALAGVAALLPLGWGRRDDVWRWFLLGSAAAGIVGTWPLLLAVCVPVPFAVWLGRRRDEPGCLKRLLLTMPVGVLPAVLAFLNQPSPAQAVASGTASASLWDRIDTFLLLDGAISTNSKDWPIVFAAAAVAAPVALLVWSRARRVNIGALGYLWFAPALALVASGAMLAYEQVRVGESRYYGVKVLCATTILAVGVAVVAVAESADRFGLLERLKAGVRVAVAASATVVMLCCAGTPVRLAPLPMSPGGSLRALSASAGPDGRRPIALAVLAACEAIDGRRGEYYLLLNGVSREDHVRAGVWIISCGMNWDSDQSPTLRVLLPDTIDKGGRSPVDVSVEARAILAQRPQATMIVTAGDALRARSRLTPQQQVRVLLI